MDEHLCEGDFDVTAAEAESFSEREDKHACAFCPDRGTDRLTTENQQVPSRQGDRYGDLK
jgi:hypothetical protein